MAILSVNQTHTLCQPNPWMDCRRHRHPFQESIFVFDVAFNKNSKLRPLIKDNSSQEDINKKPYSFSRTQLLWWTVIVITCYVINMAITGEIEGIIIGSSLALLGISAGTT